MVTKKEFLKMAESCFVNKKQYMTMVRIALDSGIIDLEKCEPNYSAVYPLATAIYKKETEWYIHGSSDDSWRRKACRQASKLYQMFYCPHQYIRNFYAKYKNFN